MPPRPPTARLPAPPPVPREARAPHLRVVPPPRSSLPPPPEGRRETLRAAPPPPPKSAPPARMSSAPPASLPLATLPPKYVPPVPDDEEEDGDTLVEGLEQDSFDATLMGTQGPASSLEPLADRLAVAARTLEAIAEDLVERIDEAMLSLAEQKVVRPVYAIGAAFAVRAMIVPAVGVFLFGVWVGIPGAGLDKTYPKTVAPLAATSAPTSVTLPPVAPPEAPSIVTEEPTPEIATPEAHAPVAPEAPTTSAAPSAGRLAMARRRVRGQRRAQARRATGRRATGARATGHRTTRRAVGRRATGRRAATSRRARRR